MYNELATEKQKNYIFFLTGKNIPDKQFLTKKGACKIIKEVLKEQIPVTTLDDNDYVETFLIKLKEIKHKVLNDDYSDLDIYNKLLYNYNKL